VSTHLRRLDGRSACGKRRTAGLVLTDDPAAVDCGGCRFTWAWAVASGCEDESPGAKRRAREAAAAAG